MFEDLKTLMSQMKDLFDFRTKLDSNFRLRISFQNHSAIYQID